MSSLQEKICQTFCLQAWQGPKWYNAFKCLLCFEVKSVLGLFCLHLNTIDWGSRMTSMIRRENWLEFRSLCLVFRIRVYGQVLGLGVRCLVLGFSLSSLNANKKLLTACHPWNHDNHHPCMGLSFHRCHGQLSKTCVPNLSCDYSTNRV